MLRNLVEHYLDSVSDERAFDATFLSLLAAEGYYDVHFLHGPLEFGKDFIAKRNDGGEERQFVFQNKAGNIATPEMRNAKGQILDATTSSLGHPAFDSSEPRTVVLVLTGRLRGNAAVEFADFRSYVEATFPKRKLIAWDREHLIYLMLKHGPEHLFRSGMDVHSYGAFYRSYGDILEQRATMSDIRSHFESRAHANATAEERIAVTALEAYLFADAASQIFQPVLKLHAMLAILRAVLLEMQRGRSAESLSAMLLASCAAVADAAQAVTNHYLQSLTTNSGLLDCLGGSALFLSYPVVCAYCMDALALQYEFGTSEQRDQAARTLQKLVQSEPGCNHPISDRYAVSVIAAIRTLIKVDAPDLARELLKESALWLIDRYWNKGSGLAPCYASESQEVRTLLGGPFMGIDARTHSGSLLATALMDISCFLQDEKIYSDLRHDILAADIIPAYYQVQDTPGQFEYEAEDIVRMPNVEFASNMPAFATFTHGNHLYGEPRSFRLSEKVPSGVYTAVSLLMRDRYFPTTWSATP